ncbi:4a-hydroxytetrahydrobiopterin dehydratase [Mycolicibacterium sp. BK556]|uniref:VOC family protein n=1 Tax=unclassified Mycolicibacterium TaxID=2636767 RepID=UPI0017C00CEE|nr:4a-hydroxytetrahydrobiopterin dehydratase [Mycolicibacterium sp. BK556]MBB3634627.1 4a-hydroxytetrahydrobiopterin dehydratase [Mycolicibacterium sp. BK607]
MITDDARPSRQEISDAIDDLGWRLILGAIQTHVSVPSMATGAAVAAVAAAAAGPDAEGHLDLDLRAGLVVMRLMDTAAGATTGRDLRVARQITEALTAQGFSPTPGIGSAVQEIELGIDAMDIAAIRPFWAAILGYVTEPGPLDDGSALVDPLHRGPTIWFQQMDAPRPQRNRIHLDVDVPHDAAAARIEAALAAGGTLLSDAAAPAWWVLADPEGNEACVCTWQGRD